MEPVRLNGPLLCIDTSIPTGSVAVVDSSGSLGDRTRTDPNSQAEKLFVVIRELLDECGLEPRGLGGVAVASGPGSFTGLRIAASTAKTMAWTLQIPLFAAGSLLCQAHRAAESRLPVCAAFDAGRGELYAACYRWRSKDGKPEELLGPGAWDLDSLCRLLGSIADDGELLVLGQGYIRQQQELEQRLGGSLKVVDQALHQPDAGSLGGLVMAEPERYLVGDVSTFEPDYIRVGQAGLRLAE